MEYAYLDLKSSSGPMFVLQLKLKAQPTKSDIGRHHYPLTSVLGLGSWACVPDIKRKGWWIVWVLSILCIMTGMNVACFHLLISFLS